MEIGVMRTIVTLEAVLSVVALTAWSMSMLPRPNDTVATKASGGVSLPKPHMAILR